MNLLTAYLSRLLADDLARSALPNAPVRPDPPRHKGRRRFQRR